MELRVTEGRTSPKRDFRSLRGRNHRILKNNLLESIAQANGGRLVAHTNEDGVVRVKLLVRKQDLKQILETMKGGMTNAHQVSSGTLSAEQRLNLLWRKNLSRANAARRRSWTPALQSIPEEI
ncbi:hypothetical protein Tsubulata_010617 [Turnera subulata]|uniref:Uncharacterized protein n=1 Tax=Turnera subulata TaxID=218843 RepID=A0A9Q0F774_9ROSI|nr:hypothetical protein Tsubulata_010617 [Turnera subulata]